MTSRPRTGIAAQLYEAQLAISNSLLDGEIRMLVGDYGYDEARLHEGAQRLAAAFAAVGAQTAATGATRHAAAQARAARRVAYANYQTLAQLVRAIYPPHAPERSKLKLVGKAPNTIPEFLADAILLFDSAASDSTISTALAAYGYDGARLAIGRAAIAAFEAARSKQHAATFAAQQATRDQEAALRALRHWLGQYLKIARIALTSEPQLLVKLGVVSGSGKRATAQV